MSNQAYLLPARLRAAATGIANARAARRGAPAIENVLDLLPEEVFTAVVDDATAALDAADAATPAPTARPGDPHARRINLAASVGLDLAAQAVVLIDVARDGTVHSSSWAEGGGMRSQAIGAWTDFLVRNLLTRIPFQTNFGRGFGGRPTPLTERQRAVVLECQRLLGDVCAIAPDSPPETARPLDGGDAEALGRALDAGSLLILARDRNSIARAALWAVSAQATVHDHETAQALWSAAARVLEAQASEGDQPATIIPQPEEKRP